MGARLKLLALVVVMAIVLAVPSSAAAQAPQQVHWRDRLCYGFPGCPDTFLFLVPVLVMMMAATTVRSIYALGGLMVLSFIVTAVVLDVGTLRVVIFIIVGLAVGLAWLAFRNR